MVLIQEQGGRASGATMETQGVLILRHAGDADTGGPRCRRRGGDGGARGPRPLGRRTGAGEPAMQDQGVRVLGRRCRRREPAPLGRRCRRRGVVAPPCRRCRRRGPSMQAQGRRWRGRGGASSGAVTQAQGGRRCRRRGTATWGDDADSGGLCLWGGDGDTEGPRPPPCMRCRSRGVTMQTQGRRWRRRET
jgi:hypothetical protein